MSKQDRQGARTPADLERRYGLRGMEKSFSEVLGVSEGVNASAKLTRAELIAFKKAIQREFSKLRKELLTVQEETENMVNWLLPVGIIITLFTDADPNTLYQGTVWERMEAEAETVSWVRTE